MSNSIHQCPHCECPEPEVPSDVCSYCGIKAEDSGYGSLCDFTVITLDGEEGHSHVTLLLCDVCVDKSDIVGKLMDLGFKNHDHGGTTFLQDPDCGAPNSCQDPNQGYGHYFVGNPHLCRTD